MQLLVTKMITRRRTSQELPDKGIKEMLMTQKILLDKTTMVRTWLLMTDFMFPIRIKDVKDTKERTNLELQEDFI